MAKPSSASNQIYELWYYFSKHGLRICCSSIGPGGISQNKIANTHAICLLSNLKYIVHRAVSFITAGNNIIATFSVDKRPHTTHWVLES